jgi:HPt (histidine-containing phosphotransfer) domain-containing protein
MSFETLNTARMQAVSLDDEEFLLELIEIFLDDTPAQMRVLSAAAAGHDLEGVRNAAHRILGASENLGAEALAAACAELEREVLDGPSASVMAELSGCVNERFDLTVEALRRYRECGE